jgi:ABC-type enterochelin transport system ATPase subunit
MDGEESIDVSLLQPTRGRITVAGEDLRTFDKSEWARVVSIVNQVSSWISTHLLQACHTQMYYLWIHSHIFSA